MRTALVYHPIYLKHDTGAHHPERASRLQSILRKLQKTPLIDKLKLVEPYAAGVDDISLVHGRDYISSIKDVCAGGGGNLDPDTMVSRDSYDAALFAAGGAMKAIDIVSGGEADNAFCILRPPGHHARPLQAMGFCLFNNVAIGARYLQNKYNIGRILIIDWDVHHGNGTEEMFYGDPTVFYMSLHQYPHYPGTGAAKDTGAGAGKGYNLNIPMQAGSGDDEYIKVFKEVIAPQVKDFRPGFILISAGFDGHRDDPLSSINLTERGYGEMTNLVREAATHYCKNRIVSVLEGGYNLFSLANSVHAHLESLTLA